MTEQIQASGSFNITRRIDAAPWSGFQKWVLFLAALAVILDGFDNQILGFAIPALIEDWGVERGAFAPIVALSLISMSIGTAFAGVVGDLFGRRPVLIASVALFGLATGSIAFANDLTTLAVLRIVAALGLGGAMPNATALLAEYTPAQRRSLAVTLGIVCVPVGGLAGGVIAAAVLPGYGWRALFAIGGVLPLLVAAVMLFALPESPGFLLKAPGKRGRLIHVLRRSGFDVSEDTVFDNSTTERQGRGPVAALFGPGFLRDTLALWVAFFATLLAVYSVFSWAPTMLASAGFDLADASSGLAGFNFGGIVGALGGAWLMDRYGSKGPTVWMAGFGAVAAGLIAVTGVVSGGEPALVIASLAVLGAFVPGLQVMLFALAAQVYPESMRASGVGAALAVGRMGAVVSSFAGVAVLSLGPAGYFAFIAVAMGVAAVSLLVIKHHITHRAGISARQATAHG